MNPAAAVARPVAALPDLLALHAAWPRRYPFLLESGGAGGPPGHDILFAFPGAALSWYREGDDAARGAAFLAGLERAWRQGRRPPATGAAGRLPFRGGWFLFLGYELGGAIEPVLRLPGAGSGALAALAVPVPAAVIRERDTGHTWLVDEAGDAGRLATMAGDIQRLREGPPPADAPWRLGQPQEEPPQRYLHAVQRALAYIRDGDLFQANLSRLWWGQWQAGSAAAVYRRLRDANPGPFNGLMCWADLAVLSTSPERLVERRGPRLCTRPIAGTRPRGGEADQDAALSAELLAHPKEQAEHVMLIDLERNDLGRVCVPGTVRVEEMMTLESYAHVHHIVSSVAGECRADRTPVDVIRALFPGGTITGCPKVRCMEVIAELEGAPRGAYTGSMGYLNRDGDMDLNILIRTLERRGDRFLFRAGAGIVADSVPEQELAETRAKARGFLLALGAEPARGPRARHA